MYQSLATGRTHVVTILYPMKRGLKVSTNNAFLKGDSRYNPLPDEKGTESIVKYTIVIVYHVYLSYNPLPDEKGTESTFNPTIHGFTGGYNPLPDEKGTERLFQCIRKNPRVVTILYPMKRGLKALSIQRYTDSPAVTILYPMKRGLKERVI